MRKEQLLDTLRQIGLSDNEAKVYLATLPLGTTTVLKIANAAGIKRSTTYDVIDSLKARGLIKTEVQGFKNKLVAEAPEKLESVLEQRKQEFQEVLPEFSALYNLRGESSFIKYHEGIRSMEAVYDSLIADIKTGEPYYVVANLEESYKRHPKFFQKFIERRSKLNIDLKVILDDTPRARERLKVQHVYGERIKLLPKEKIFTSNLIVTPQRLVVYQVVEPVKALVVENQSMIKTFQEVFEFMWSALPE